MKEILLTGGLGFIGRNLLSELVKKEIKVNLLVRPEKRIPEYAKTDLIRPIYADLKQLNNFEGEIRKRHFDTIFHIGAIRGGREAGREAYKKVNVEATAHLAKIALVKKAKFIYCSSVGVFGAIPKQLPPTEATERQRDNYYHTTKIQAENKLHNLKKEGLNYIIIRPSITYGTDDFGFPYALINMIYKGKFINCAASVKINMVDIRSLAQAFINAATTYLKNGSAYNLCDRSPVDLKDLANFISQHLFHSNYPKIKTLPTFAFRAGEFVFDKILKNELWKARFQLISRSWYYDPCPAMKALAIIPKKTIPNFKYVIDWYKNYAAIGQ
jgi:nucleoside-diphosphate-sugar epimerase